MAQLNPQRNHYLLANLEQYELINLIRKATDNHEIILWEMLGLNNSKLNIRSDISNIVVKLRKFTLINQNQNRGNCLRNKLCQFEKIIL